MSLLSDTAALPHSRQQPIDYCKKHWKHHYPDTSCCLSKYPACHLCGGSPRVEQIMRKPYFTICSIHRAQCGVAPPDVSVTSSRLRLQNAWLNTTSQLDQRDALQWPRGKLLPSCVCAWLIVCRSECASLPVYGGGFLYVSTWLPPFPSSLGRRFSLVSLCKCACESELVSSQVQLRSRVFIDKNQDASFSLRKATINMHLDVFTFQSCVRARLCQKLGGSKDLRHHAGNQMFTLNDHIGSLNLTFFLTSARLASNMCLNCQTAALLKWQKPTDKDQRGGEAADIIGPERLKHHLSADVSNFQRKCLDNYLMDAQEMWCSYLCPTGWINIMRLAFRAYYLSWVECHSVLYSWWKVH